MNNCPEKCKPDNRMIRVGLGLCISPHLRVSPLRLRLSRLFVSLSLSLALRAFLAFSSYRRPQVERIFDCCVRA